MKHYLTVALLLCLLASCVKDMRQPSPRKFAAKIKKPLEASMTSSDFRQLDFYRTTAIPVSQEQTTFFSIPFKGEMANETFVVVEADAAWNFRSAKIIHLQGDVGITSPQSGARHYNGEITIYSLDRAHIFHSPINAGYITGLRSREVVSSITPPTAPVKWVELPEVIVVGSAGGGNNIIWSTWINLPGLFGNQFGENYYAPVDPSLNGGGGGGGGGAVTGNYNGGGSYGGGEGGVKTVKPITIDRETVIDKRAIEIEKFIRCFNAIADKDSDCTVEIFTDIPVDGDPGVLMHWDSQSPGHSFIQLRKSNGGQLVTQNIGFYPTVDWKAILTPDPIDGKFVDNGLHEFNAALKMKLTPADFRAVLAYIEHLSTTVQYDIDEYNCTDWALRVFNYKRADKLQIPKYNFPSSNASFGTSTPQGLYRQLRAMKDSRHPEAANINIDIVKGWAGNSDGPCP